MLVWWGSKIQVTLSKATGAALTNQHPKDHSYEWPMGYGLRRRSSHNLADGNEPSALHFISRPLRRLLQYLLPTMDGSLISPPHASSPFGVNRYGWILRTGTDQQKIPVAPVRSTVLQQLVCSQAAPSRRPLSSSIAEGTLPSSESMKAQIVRFVFTV